MDNILKFIGAAILIIALVVACFLFSGLVIMLVWNAFVPAALGGAKIGFWTAVAGSILLSIVGSAFRSVTK